MRKLRIYVDTSVIGGCLDEEFRDESQKLIEYARQGRVVLLVSAIVAQELQLAPAEVNAVMDALPEEATEDVPVTTEARELADAYIRQGIVGTGSLDDARHVALATVARADAIASWNFRHIVRMEKMKGYNAVNLLNGYGMLTIVSPREITIDEDEDQENL